MPYQFLNASIDNFYCRAFQSLLGNTMLVLRGKMRYNDTLTILFLALYTQATLSFIMLHAKKREGLVDFHDLMNVV